MVAFDTERERERKREREREKQFLGTSWSVIVKRIYQSQPDIARVRSHTSSHYTMDRSRACAQPIFSSNLRDLRDRICSRLISFQRSFREANDSNCNCSDTIVDLSKRRLLIVRRRCVIFFNP